jgi:hypothetical protein
MAITVAGTNITMNDATVQGTAFLGFRSQFFVANGTFTIPTGVTAIKATVQGGGGGGGGIYVGGSCAVGGGAGGYGVQYFTGLTPGNTLAVTVGAAGTAGGGGGGTGGTGGTSSLASGTQTITTLSSAGGPGGGNDARTSTPSTRAPGAVTNASFFAGFGATPSNVERGYSGSGGNSGFGVGGLSVAPINNGNAGSGYGAGGSGAAENGSDNRSGGAGTAGCVLIEW